MGFHLIVMSPKMLKVFNAPNAKGTGQSKERKENSFSSTKPQNKGSGQAFYS